MIEKTLVLIKPDGVQRGISGKIIERFENAGLKITAMKMVWIDKEFSKKHYKDHISKAFYPTLEDMITSGPVIALVLEGVEAIEVIRKLVGGTEPKNAAPGTIRGDFSHHSYSYADKHKKSIANIIHASSSKKDAEFEVSLWFGKDEIHSYKTVHEKHTF